MRYLRRAGDRPRDDWVLADVDSLGDADVLRIAGSFLWDELLVPVISSLPDRFTIFVCLPFRFEFDVIGFAKRKK